MLVPHPIPWTDGETLGEHLDSRGVSRREFLEFCAGPGGGARARPPGRFRRSLGRSRSLKRPCVVWIQLQECTGCVESVLRTAEPTIGNLVLDLVSLDYSHTLMAAAGTAAERALQDAMSGNAGKYLLVVTGSVPARRERHLHHDRRPDGEGDSGGGGAGSCGGDRDRRLRPLGQRSGGQAQPHGAVGVSRIVKDKPVVNIAGCPADRRRGHRDDRPLPDLRPPAGARRRGSAALRLRRAYPRSVPPSRQLRRRPVRRGVRRRGRAEGLVPLPRRLQGPRDVLAVSHLPVELAAPAGPSARAIRASAAPSPTSGTR